jgi:hypothetical protein
MVQVTLKDALEPSKRINSVAVAEKFLLALNAANKLNPSCVSCVLTHG